MSSVGTNKNVPESEPKYNIFQRQRFVVVHLVRYFRGQSRGLCSLNKLWCRLMRCCQPGPKVFVDEAHWVAIFRTPLRWLKPPADFLVGCWLHLARYLPAYVVDVIMKCVIIKCNGGAKGTNHEHSAMTNNSRNKNQSFRRWQATGDEKSLCFEFFSEYSSQLVPAAMGVRRIFSTGVQHPHCSYPFQVADDTMQLDVHKSLAVSTPQTKHPMLRQQSEKSHFVCSTASFQTV